MALTDDQKEELKKKGRKSAAYRSWYETNKERIALQRKSRYENDPEYREKILANRKRQREREKVARSQRAVKGNVLENRSYKSFKVNSEEHGSAVTYFLSIGQVAAVLEMSVPTLRKWERDGVMPAPIYRSKGGHRLYTIDQSNCIKDVYATYKARAEATGSPWKLTDAFKAELALSLNNLHLGVKPSSYSK
jgi:hypothetical protein